VSGSQKKFEFSPNIFGERMCIYFGIDAPCPEQKNMDEPSVYSCFGDSEGIANPFHFSE